MSKASVCGGWEDILRAAGWLRLTSGESFEAVAPRKTSLSSLLARLQPPACGQDSWRACTHSSWTRAVCDHPRHPKPCRAAILVVASQQQHLSLFLTKFFCIVSLKSHTPC